MLGAIGGLAPGLTTIMSSQLAYIDAKRRNLPPVEKIIAAETANNAGAFTMLIPLLMLGIPLAGSEALILMLVEMKAFQLGKDTFSETIKLVSFFLIFINVLPSDSY